MFQAFSIGRTSLRLISAVVGSTFLIQSLLPANVLAQISPQPSAPSVHIPVSTSVNLYPSGLSLNPENPFEFELLVEQGEGQTFVGVDPRVYPSQGEHGGSPLQEDAMRLIKYFLASLTIPEKDMWVNLNPNEPDRIVPPAFAQTAMGRDMLGQDYVLKQLTSSLMNPDGEEGKKFWEKVYEKVYASGIQHSAFGEKQQPNANDQMQDAIQTLNKVWIIPEKAVVYQNGFHAYVVESKLKVMLEEDYLASGISHSASGEKLNANDQMLNAQQIIRETILPLIEDEVNNGESFANLRQMYRAMILSYWFKQNLKKSLLGQVYVDQKKMGGIVDENVTSNEKRVTGTQDVRYPSPVTPHKTIDEIYNQYVEQFRQGAFDLIKEDYDPQSQETIVRKYFSGGTFGDPQAFEQAYGVTNDAAMVVTGDNAQLSIRFVLDLAGRVAADWRGRFTFEPAREFQRIDSDGAKMFLRKPGTRKDVMAKAPMDLEKVLSYRHTESNLDPMASFVRAGFNALEEYVGKIDPQFNFDRYLRLREKAYMHDGLSDREKEQLRQLEVVFSKFTETVVFLPVRDDGAAAGAIMALKHLSPRIRVVAVTSSRFNAMFRAFEAGYASSTQGVQQQALEILAGYADGIVSLDDVRDDSDFSLASEAFWNTDVKQWVENLGLVHVMFANPDGSNFQASLLKDTSREGKFRFDAQDSFENHESEASRMFLRRSDVKAKPAHQALVSFEQLMILSQLKRRNPMFQRSFGLGLSVFEQLMAQHDPAFNVKEYLHLKAKTERTKQEEEAFSQMDAVVRQMPLTTVFLPVSEQLTFANVLLFLKHINPDIKVMGVSAEYDAMYDSFATNTNKLRGVQRPALRDYVEFSDGIIDFHKSSPDDDYTLALQAREDARVDRWLEDNKIQQVVMVSSEADFKISPAKIHGLKVLGTYNGFSDIKMRHGKMLLRNPGHPYWLERMNHALPKWETMLLYRRAFQEVLGDAIKYTPFIEVKDKLFRIFINDEGQQGTNSFKPRIIAQFLVRLLTEAGRKAVQGMTITTGTTGNQGQAVAWMVQALNRQWPDLNLKAVIFAAEDTPEKKVRRMEGNSEFEDFEFINGLTPEALVEAIRASGISIPSADSPIKALNLLMKDASLYKRLQNVPDVAREDFIDRMERRGHLSEFHVTRLNRLLIEANFEALTPKRNLKGYGAEVHVVEGQYEVARNAAIALEAKSKISGEAKTAKVEYMTHSGPPSVNSYAASAGIEMIQKIITDIQNNQGKLQGFDYEQFLKWKSQHSNNVLSDKYRSKYMAMQQELDEALSDWVEFVPVGAGGIAVAIMAAAKMISPRIKFIGVFTENTNSAYYSVKAGHVVKIRQKKGLMEDGIGVDEIEEEALKLFLTVADGLVEVPSRRIPGGIRAHWEKAGIMSEGASVLPYLASQMPEVRQWMKANGIKNIACFSTGSNIIEKKWMKITGAKEIPEVNRAMLDESRIAKSEDMATWKNIMQRLVWYSTKMIAEANADRTIPLPGIGGHQSAAASSAHIIAALRFFVMRGEDVFANKPHAQPLEQSINYMLGLIDEDLMRRLRENAVVTVDRSWQDHLETEDWEILEKIKSTMHPSAVTDLDRPGIQPYPAVADVRSAMIPTGSVGMGPAVAIAAAVLKKWAKDHGHDVPDSHYFALLGDAEFEEGNLQEILPLASEMDAKDVTLIVDYNRQSLDGNTQDHKLTQMIERFEATGWKVVELKWGSKFDKFFEGKIAVGSAKDLFYNFLDRLSQEEYQNLISKSGAEIRAELLAHNEKIDEAINGTSDDDLFDLVTDLAGHDLLKLTQVLEEARASDQPTAVIAHTIKGWGLKPLIGKATNHSTPLTEAELRDVQEKFGIPDEDPFAKFDPVSEEGKIIVTAQERILQEEFAAQEAKAKNRQLFTNELENLEIPEAVGVEIPRSQRLVTTQDMFGMIMARMRSLRDAEDSTLSSADRFLKRIALRMPTVSADVSTSTGLQVKGQLGTGYTPGNPQDFHFRLGIIEMTTVTMAIVLGKALEFLGVQLFPVMTVYDMFLFRRALDMVFYGQYWKSRAILVGTPSGTTLSPEGPQHQSMEAVLGLSLPNIITWDPSFPQELDYIFGDTFARMATQNDEGRNIVYVRGSTFRLNKNILMERLQQQKRYEGQESENILKAWKDDVLLGGYRLVDYTGYEGYEPGENVINIVTTGPLVEEALAISDFFRDNDVKGQRWFVNVIVASSPELLKGRLAEKTRYAHLRTLIPVSEGEESQWSPLVTVADAPKEYLGGIGGILGVREEVLGIQQNGAGFRHPQRSWEHQGIGRRHIAGTILAMINEFEDVIKVNDAMLSIEEIAKAIMDDIKTELTLGDIEDDKSKLEELNDLLEGLRVGKKKDINFSFKGGSATQMTLTVSRTEDGFDVESGRNSSSTFSQSYELDDDIEELLSFEHDDAMLTSPRTEQKPFNVLTGDVNGIPMPTLLNFLAESGVFDVLDHMPADDLKREIATNETSVSPQISVKSLAQAIKRKDTIQESDVENLGNVWRFFHVLNNANYVSMEGSGENTTVSLTASGVAAAAIAQAGYFHEFARAVPYLKGLHPLSRGEANADDVMTTVSVQDRVENPVEHFEGLVGRMSGYVEVIRVLRSDDFKDVSALKAAVRGVFENGFLDESSWKVLEKIMDELQAFMPMHILQRELLHAHTHIVGLMMSYVAIALGMPNIERDPQGLIVQGRSVYSFLDGQQAKTMGDIRTESGFNLDEKWLGLILRAAQAGGLVEAQGQRFLKTSFGEGFQKIFGSYGVPSSYPRILENIADLFGGDPYPVDLYEDQHMQLFADEVNKYWLRLVDIWGSGAAHGTYAGQIKERGDEQDKPGITTVTWNKFNNDDFDSQPDGMFNFGAGDGQNAKKDLHTVLKSRRGAILSDRPLVYVVTDISETALNRAHKNLEEDDLIKEAVENKQIYLIYMLVDITEGPDTLDQEKFENKLFDALQGLKIKAGHEYIRDLQLVDFWQTSEFIFHERHLKVRSDEESRIIIREALENVDLNDLREALKVSMGHEVNPELLDADRREGLIDLIMSQFRLSYAVRGRLVPGYAAAADLIVLLKYWSRYAGKHGMRILELHDVRPNALVEKVPASIKVPMKTETMLFTNYSFTHSVLQEIIPFVEQRLIYVLAGLKVDPTTSAEWGSADPKFVMNSLVQLEVNNAELAKAADDAMFSVPTTNNRFLNVILQAIIWISGYHSNVHRGLGQYSQISTELLEHGREKVVFDALSEIDGQIYSHEEYELHYGTRRNISYEMNMIKREGDQAEEFSIGTGDVDASGKVVYRYINTGDINFSLGVGLILVRKDRLPAKDVAPPIPAGGTVAAVTDNFIIWNHGADKYEPGTPNVFGAVMLSKALQMIANNNGDRDLFKDKPVLTFDQVKDVLYAASKSQHHTDAILKEIAATVLNASADMPIIDDQGPYKNFDAGASTQTFTSIADVVAVLMSGNLSEEDKQRLAKEVETLVLNFLVAPPQIYDFIPAQNSTEASHIIVAEMVQKYINRAEALGNKSITILGDDLAHNSSHLIYRFLKTPQGKDVNYQRIPIDERGIYDLQKLETLMRDSRPEILTINAASNALGTVNNLDAIMELARKYNVKIILDGAQHFSHRGINLSKWNDVLLAYFFSAHKTYAPYGSGGAVINKAFIRDLQIEKRVAELKAMGQENIVGLAALGRAVVLLNRIGMDRVADHERKMVRKMVQGLKDINATVAGGDLEIHGLTDDKDLDDRISVITFSSKKLFPRNFIGMYLAVYSAIASRNGCFCAGPAVASALRISLAKGAKLEELLRMLDEKSPNDVGNVLPGVVRVSFGLYNTEEEVEDFLKTIRQMYEVFNSKNIPVFLQKLAEHNLPFTFDAEKLSQPMAEAYAAIFEEGWTAGRASEEFAQAKLFTDGLFAKTRQEIRVKAEAVVDKVFSDNAMFTNGKDIQARVVGDTKTKGGIDFDPTSMKFETQGNAAMLNPSPDLLKKFENAPGFSPVIINIRPVGNLPQWLGLNVDEVPVDSESTPQTADMLWKKSLSYVVRPQDFQKIV